MPSRGAKQTPARKSSSVMDAAGQLADPRAARESRHDSRSKFSNTPLIAAGAAVGVAALAALVFAFGGAGSDAPGKKLSPLEDAPQPVAMAVNSATVSKLELSPTAPGNTPAPSTLPAPVAPSTQTAQQSPPTSARPSAGNENEELRNELAAGKLQDAKQFALSTPADPWSYKEKLEAVAGTFRSTPAGHEAQLLLASLKVPEKPPPPTPLHEAELPKATGDLDDRDRPQNMDGINSACRDSWMAVNGALEMKPNINDAGQSAVDYGDGEFRIRFQPSQSSYFSFSPHQGEGAIGVHLDRLQLQSLEGKQHEIVVVCAGDKFKATLDGVPIEVDKNGAPRQGRIQFSYHGRCDAH